jgi:oligopeptide/dipeptide ABC transporter ATP-binding protein
MPELSLEATGLLKRFHRRHGTTRATLTAVDGVDVALPAGQTLALVGESGSGKSTVARILTRLTRPDEGRVMLGEQDLVELRGRELAEARRAIQMVFQDPHASLDPRMTARAATIEPWAVHRMYTRQQRTTRARELLLRVGLPGDRVDRYPHQLSGGEAQRVAIARALALEPSIVVLDEPVSALDVSIQAQVLELLKDLQASLGLSYMFISHDLAVVDQIAHRIAVMYLGRIVETGPRNEVLQHPAHPYTEALISAVPVPEVTERGGRPRIVLSGELPSGTDAITGCRFRTRCWKAAERCATDDPVLVTQQNGVQVACHFPSKTLAS